MCGFATVSLSPRMELPPLSPGIHDNVIDVVVVLVTVRRGWSGGTEDGTKVNSIRLSDVSRSRFSVTSNTMTHVGTPHLWPRRMEDVKPLCLEMW